MPPSASATEQVLSVVKRSGGGVSVTEIVHKTDLDYPAAIDALDELEQEGLVTPWAWGLGPEAER